MAPAKAKTHTVNKPLLYRVTAPVNLRPEPTTGQPALGIADPGQVIALLDAEVADPNWWQVSTLSKGINVIGYAAHRYLSPIVIPEPVRVFVCHSSDDKERVRDIDLHLQEAEFIEPWLDERELLGGEEFDQSIVHEISESHAVIVCLSKAVTADTNRYVHLEIARALKAATKGTLVIPAMLEPCDLPKQLQDKHAVNLFEEKGLERIIRSLRKHAEGIQLDPLKRLQAASRDLGRSYVYLSNNMKKALREARAPLPSAADLLPRAALTAKWCRGFHLRLSTLKLGLMGIGYYAGVVNDESNNELVRAIARFQSDYGLMADGSFGPDSFSKMAQQHLLEPLHWISRNKNV
jgi:hypothetical protein